MVSRALAPFDPGRRFTVRQSTLLLAGEPYVRGDEVKRDGVPDRALRRLYEQQRICYSDDIPPLKKPIFEKSEIIEHRARNDERLKEIDSGKIADIKAMVAANSKKELLERAEKAGIDPDDMPSGKTKADLAGLIYEAERDGAT